MTPEVHRHSHLTPSAVGYSINTRFGARSLPSLIRRHGDQVWQGGDGAPELNREGADPRRPWM